MIRTTRKAALAGLAIVSSAILLAGCGAAPEEEPAGSGSGATEPADDFIPCLISDEGGWNDRSFNQSAKEGMDRAAEELGVEAEEMESTTANDYAPNLETLVSNGCS